MSAIEALPVTDRRRAERLRPASSIRVMIGRGTGTILDLSRGGLRVRHTLALTRGTQVRVAFDWQNERFDAVGEVLASRVATLGDHSGAPTMFETRVRFSSLREGSQEILERVLSAITSRELRRWVENLHGWSDATRRDETAENGAFIRCRLIGRQWQKTWTHDPTQPANGFLLPATVTPQELESLCVTYGNAQLDGRHLIHLMAEEAVKEVLTPRAVAV
jgi:hypothetical protein